MIEYRIWPEVTEEVMGTPICGDDTDGAARDDAIRGYLADLPTRPRRDAIPPHLADLTPDRRVDAGPASIPREVHDVATCVRRGRATGEVASQSETADPGPTLPDIVENAMRRILAVNPGATVTQREGFRRVVVDTVTAAALAGWGR